MNDLVIYTNQQYKDAFKEVLAILNYIPESDYRKIPNDIITNLKSNASTSYDFYIDPEKSIKEQNLSEIAKAILENFYRDYWVTNAERNLIIKEEKLKRQEIEKEKAERYNPDNLFKNTKEIEKEETYDIKQEMNLVEYKESILSKIIKRIKALFHN